MKVAIIPARGGSKRIPRKNIKLFCGKPMIAWSIEAAQKSGIFDRIIVSTDDNEVAEVAKIYGAETPFLRPVELANDFTGTIPVIKHACEFINQEGGKIDYACCIYATAPFIEPDDIIEGFNIIKKSDADYAFAVTGYQYPIQRALRINDLNEISMINPELFNKRSQDLEEVWHDAGQFYWGSYKAWVSEIPVFSSKAKPIKLPRERTQDIDTPEDWRVAELLFQIGSKYGNSN